jgi:hypothetical protein
MKEARKRFAVTIAFRKKPKEQVTRNTTTEMEDDNEETEPKNHIQQTSKSTCN